MARDTREQVDRRRVGGARFGWARRHRRRWRALWRWESLRWVDSWPTRPTAGRAHAGLVATATSVPTGPDTPGPTPTPAGPRSPACRRCSAPGPGPTRAPYSDLPLLGWRRRDLVDPGGAAALQRHDNTTARRVRLLCRRRFCVAVGFYAEPPAVRPTRPDRDARQRLLAAAGRDGSRRTARASSPADASLQSIVCPTRRPASPGGYNGAGGQFGLIDSESAGSWSAQAAPAARGCGGGPGGLSAGPDVSDPRSVCGHRLLRGGGPPADESGLPPRAVPGRSVECPGRAAPVGLGHRCQRVQRPCGHLVCRGCARPRGRWSWSPASSWGCSNSSPTALDTVGGPRARRCRERGRWPQRRVVHLRRDLHRGGELQQRGQRRAATHRHRVGLHRHRHRGTTTGRQGHGLGQRRDAERGVVRVGHPLRRRRLLPQQHELGP